MTTFREAKYLLRLHSSPSLFKVKPVPGSQIVVKTRKKKACEKLAWRGGGGKEKGREAPALPSFLPFYFRVCAFSIQRTPLPRNLEQAIQSWAKLDSAICRINQYSVDNGLRKRKGHLHTPSRSCFLFCYWIYQVLLNWNWNEKTK